jgi:kinesin family protein C1
VQSRLFEAEEDADSNKALVTTLKEEVKNLKQKLFKAESTRRKLHNELQDLKGNIRVFARARPANEHSVLAIDDENGSVMVPHNGTQTGFKFDRAFNARSSQEDVFAEVSQFVQSALDGYNVSLFAYGQTGSGKTHTMFGTGSDSGIIPRSIAQILDTVEEAKENNWEYALEASFLEIYNETIFDLLTPETEREGKKYTIVAGENGRHDVTDLEWRTVRTQEDVEKMLEAAQSNKHVARTGKPCHDTAFLCSALTCLDTCLTD